MASSQLEITLVEEPPESILDVFEEGLSEHLHLDTFSFQARPFYEKLGFEVYAVLDDYPPGHQRFYLRKRLV